MDSDRLRTSALKLSMPDGPCSTRKESPWKRGRTCRWQWNTSCPAASPSDKNRLTPSQRIPDWRDGTYQMPPDSEDAGTGRLRQIGQRGVVRLRDHQSMPGVDGSVVQKRQDEIVRVHRARRLPPCDDVAKDAHRRGAHRHCATLIYRGPHLPTRSIRHTITIAWGATAGEQPAEDLELARDGELGDGPDDR